MKHWIFGLASISALLTLSQVAGASSSDPFNYMWCNGGDFVMKNECAVTPASGSGGGELRNVCSLRVEINGFKASGKGVVRYLESAGALSPDEIFVGSTYDPATHTYPETLSTHFYGLNQSCAPDESCFWFFNNADTIDFGRGTIRYDAGGYRVTVSGPAGTANWRFESCDTRWLNL